MQPDPQYFQLKLKLQFGQDGMKNRIFFMKISLLRTHSQILEHLAIEKYSYLNDLNKAFAYF